MQILSARRSFLLAALLAPGFSSSAQDAKPATNHLLSVYAAYNNVSGEKSIRNDPSAGHTNTPKASKAMRHGVLEHVKAQAAK